MMIYLKQPQELKLGQYQDHYGKKSQDLRDSQIKSMKRKRASCKMREMENEFYGTVG